jgi:hypothetical protein
MRFKYQYLVDDLGLNDCPPKDFGTSDRKAFRFIFQNIEHENNFKPIALINPKRLNDFEESSQKCQSFGLSLFAEKQKAEMHYIKMMQKTAGKFGKTVGSHLAELQLLKTDGVHSNPEEAHNSHFTFHESVDSNLKSKILKIDLLENGY